MGGYCKTTLSKVAQRIERLECAFRSLRGRQAKLGHKWNSLYWTQRNYLREKIPLRHRAVMRRAKLRRAGEHAKFVYLSKRIAKAISMLARVKLTKPLASGEMTFVPHLSLREWMLLKSILGRTRRPRNGPGHGQWLFKFKKGDGHVMMNRVMTTTASRMRST